MIAKKYDTEVSKILPIHVDVPEGTILTNYYPHYIMARSTEIANLPWNQKGFSMNYNVVWESEDMKSGYPAYVGIRFRIYRGEEYVGSCYVKYDCRNGEIIKLNIKIKKSIEDVTEEDVKEFIQQVILIFGKLAFIEFTKNKRPGAITVVEHEHKTRTYVVTTWQKHGYYNKRNLYIKSCICYRNKELLN